MSYATYSGATGLPPVAPNKPVTFNIHQNRDRIRDNLTVTRRQRLSAGATICSEQMYASYPGGDGDFTVSMPYKGVLSITNAGGDTDLNASTITVDNPFITPTTTVLGVGNSYSVTVENGRFVIGSTAAIISGGSTVTFKVI